MNQSLSSKSNRYAFIAQRILVDLARLLMLHSSTDGLMISGAISL